jgi:hypothetical protein
MMNQMDKQTKLLLAVFISFFLVMIILGISADGIVKSFTGFLWLQMQPARLINDFFALAGIGATLFNATAVGIIALGFVLLLKVRLSGPTFAAIFTIFGFGLFGKTVFNILPIIIGVCLAAKLANKTYQEYAIIALFGTAIGPLVSFFAFELGFTGIPGMLIGSGFGIIIGMLLPAVAISMLHMHQGYNLYNIGLTTGFIGIFFAAIIKASGYQFTAQMNWYDKPSLLLSLLVPSLSIILILIGTISGGKKAWKKFLKIQTHSGRLPSDFMESESTEAAFINAGLIGLIGSLYVLIIGADFNGPVIGGLLTIIGFATFGTHLKNSWPVVTGVIITSLIFGKPLTAPAPILATIFCTTLAPLTGQFGILTGLIAGFLHFVIVLQTGSWHGGISLYNNGFAGGITATMIVAIIQWYRNAKKG